MWATLPCPQQNPQEFADRKHTDSLHRGRLSFALIRVAELADLSRACGASDSPWPRSPRALAPARGHSAFPVSGRCSKRLANGPIRAPAYDRVPACPAAARLARAPETALSRGGPSRANRQRSRDGPYAAALAQHEDDAAAQHEAGGERPLRATTPRSTSRGRFRDLGGANPAPSLSAHLFLKHAATLPHGPAVNSRGWETPGFPFSQSTSPQRSGCTGINTGSAKPDRGGNAFIRAESKTAIARSSPRAGTRFPATRPAAGLPTFSAELKGYGGAGGRPPCRELRIGCPGRQPSHRLPRRRAREKSIPKRPAGAPLKLSPVWCPQSAPASAGRTRERRSRQCVRICPGDDRCAAPPGGDEMQPPAIAPGRRRCVLVHRYQEGAIRSSPEAFASASFGATCATPPANGTVIQFVRCEAGVLEEIASGALRLDTERGGLRSRPAGVQRRSQREARRTRIRMTLAELCGEPRRLVFEQLLLVRRSPATVRTHASCAWTRPPWDRPNGTRVRQSRVIS